MNLSILLFSVTAFLSTFIGGVVGLKNKDKLHLILGFTAGIILGVVAFDIFPEIMTLTHTLKLDPRLSMIAFVAAFLLFHIGEKLFLIHHVHEEEYGKHKHPTLGAMSALALVGHSFMDGVGIGLGFHVSNTIGLLVTLAVVSHDFADGLNTVSLMLMHKNTHKNAKVMLVADSLAPVLGGLSTMFFTISDRSLVIYLGFFAGFLMYICSSDILPEAHSSHSSWKTIAMTVVGIVFIYVITGLLPA